WRRCVSMARELLSIVLATSNPRKQSELRGLLADLPVNWLGVEEAIGHGYVPPDELGATLEENACIKARAASVATGLVALADDSGLEVEALGWRPGVRSASFAHDRATDAENNAALLSALHEVPAAERGARFRTVLVVRSEEHTSELQSREN